MSFDSSRSANSNSAQKSSSSKRSFNSNPSNNSNNKKNKRSNNQKTLGMAWGSNSLSSSRSSSFRKSPFADFGSYMVEKNRKLQNQFDAEASNSSHSGSSSAKPIFHGVSIFVDGFTVPSSQELRGYMLNHGGQFENYFSRHRVTHIICSNLPDSKIKNLRSFSRGLPVVKPTWILDSVAANKLLSWIPYQLDQLANNQPKLSDFFASKGAAVCEDALTDVVCQVKPKNIDPSFEGAAESYVNSSQEQGVEHRMLGITETEDPSLKGGTSKEASSFEEDESVEHGKQISGKPDDLVPESTDAAMIEDQSNARGRSCEIEMVELGKHFIKGEGNTLNEIQFCPEQPQAHVSSYCLENQSVKGSCSLVDLGSSKQHHSTLQDPNFVENYFKSSRLHFIGTWRNRYRKRFPSLANEFKCTGSNLVNPDTTWKTTIIHIDMDCFFVSVVIKQRPELQDKPVAVCHSDNPKGTAEISSANYPARAYGVKAGMFVRDAKALCPHLAIVPYHFEAYEEVADQFYNILHKRCNKVQAVSCDEAFLDVTELQGEDPDLLASAIRKEIFEITGCTASAGISVNMLMSRLATRTAKPNGQCYIPQERVDEYLNQLPIKALPGIGHVLEEKLKLRNVRTCGQLRMISKDSLKNDFGTKTGEMLWNYCRGVDNRLVGVIQESKSIGAEVNWGVRFRDIQHSQHFLLNLCKEVSLRLQGCGVRGRTFTLKIKKRRKDAGEPAKYMGCGDCENMSHSITVPAATDDVEVIQRMTKQLFGSFHLDVKEIRGIGLQVSKLENADTSNKGLERNSLKSWLLSASASTEQCNATSVAKKRVSADFKRKKIDGTSDSCQRDGNPSHNEAHQVSGLPPLSHLDIEVLKALPPEMFSELNETYGGKLADFIAKNKGKTENFSSSSSTHPHEQVDGTTNGGEGSLFCDRVSAHRKSLEFKARHHTGTEIWEAPVSGEGSCSETFHKPVIDRADLLPSSLSQVDTSVLQQLPEEMRLDILEQLSTHRRQECPPNVAFGPLTENSQKSAGIRITADQSGSLDCVISNNLWIGNPPKWVEKFKASSFLILNSFAKLFYKSGSTENLSPILQRMNSESLHISDTSCDGWDEAVHKFSELLKQYIKLKIERDIEEIYVCFRLLRRLMLKSNFFVEVHNIVFPYLQASVGETYGGSLQIS